MSTEAARQAPSTASGTGGAVAAGDLIAAEAAIEVLAEGGNAVDAAIAASAVQCVVEMAWCGLGGDAFAMVNTPDTTIAVNGSGAAPAGLTGVPPGAIPRFGALSVSVPGTVEVWDRLAAELGTRPLSHLLRPAIAFAEDGFTVGERLGAAFDRLQPELDEYPGLAQLLDGNGVKEGGTFVQSQLAETLRVIARHGASAFYEGTLAEAMVRDLQSRGGVVTKEDLAQHSTDWVEPISVEYRGHHVLEHPPVSLGVTLLQELKILEGFDPASLDHEGSELTDLMIQCKRAAFTDAFSHLGDPHHEQVPVDWMISEDRADWWRHQIGRDSEMTTVTFSDGVDTTSLAVTDSLGNTVTFIHSLFNEFGSREAPGDLGLILNDRLGNLVLEGGRPGGIRPGHRPIHTLNSVMVMDHGKVSLAGATPGGRGQVQTLFQVLVRYLDHRLDIERALGAPRWLHGSPRTRWADHVVNLETTFPVSTRQELADHGYDVTVPDDNGSDIFGSCTLVSQGHAEGSLLAAADHRRGAAALAF